ncbi:ATPase, T2SS/T4P/T4SS family [Ferrimicrobium sp.]|uniref:ATPase, T2SS/T4P/T4SS family n=1 Tax=Ferrimicrobium sp. TaxID=2926050 RepID=UPI00262DF827|nr:ATPase, T2SS/T4P/T4SS family [Ferrimicrobium sp.]
MGSMTNTTDELLRRCALIESRVQAAAKQEHLDPSDRASARRVYALARSEAERAGSGSERDRQECAHYIADYVTRSMLGAGPLQPLLDDPRLEEIMINGPRDIFVIRSGIGHLRYPEGFYHEAHLRRIIERIAAGSLGSSRALDPSEGIQDISLRDGSRLHLVHPELSANGHMLVNLRRITRYSSEVHRQTPLYDLLIAALNAGATVVIAGQPGSGKTTLARHLLSGLEPRSRVVIAEEVAETGVNLANVAHLQTRKARRGVAGVDLRMLVAAFLRMAPSVAVVGEIRDREALPFLLTTTSGIPGLSTIHARDARGALTRLRLLAELNGAAMSAESLSQLIAEGIDIVIYLTKVASNFMITEIVLVEDVVSTNGQTNFVTIQLTIDNGALASPIPLNARIFRRYPGLRHFTNTKPIAELV